MPKDILEKLKGVIIPGSSVGFHAIYKGMNVNQYSIYEHIEEEGLNITYPCYGLVGNITMLNPIDEFTLDDEETIANDNIGYKVIIAIPKTISGLGDEFYLGNFNSYSNGYGKDDKRALSLPINWIEHLPKEFVVGLYAIDYNDNNRPYFISNPSYIGLQNEEEKNQFYAKFIFANNGVFTSRGMKRFNDQDISRANFVVKVLERGTYYEKEFYDEAMARKGRPRRLKKD